MFNKILKFIKQVPDKAYKWAMWISISLTAIVWGGGPILKKAEFLGVLKIYNSILNFFPTIEQDIVKYKYVITSICCIIILAHLTKRFYREKAMLIKHHSMSSNIAAITPSLSEKYKLVIITINQYDATTIKEAICIQDSILKEALVGSYNKYIYYGIALTPYVFRAGFQFGDERNIEFLHKKRSNETLFEEIPKKEDAYAQLTQGDYGHPIDSQELLVSLATSFSIEHYHLECFKPDTLHRLYFCIDSPNVDSILSYERMKRFREEIMITIRKVVRQYNIKTIHITAATSQAFAFFWAQSFSKNHDPDVIVYHYENGTYPWGINIKEPAPTCLVENQVVEQEV